MIYVTSLIFNIVFFGIIFCYGIMCHIFFFNSRSLIVKASVWACSAIIFVYKKICRVKINFNNLQEVVNKDNSIFFVQHQSYVDTTFFHILLKDPIYILKDSLFNMLSGRIFKKIGCIGVSQHGTNHLREFLKNVKNTLESKDKSIILFPEGTRMPHGVRGQIKNGAYLLYSQFRQYNCYFVSLDSGKLWPRRSFLKYPGVINVNFKLLQNKNYSKEEFNKALSDFFYGSI